MTLRANLKRSVICMLVTSNRRLYKGFLCDGSQSNGAKVVKTYCIKLETSLFVDISGHFGCTCTDRPGMRRRRARTERNSQRRSARPHVLVLINVDSPPSSYLASLLYSRLFYRLMFDNKNPSKLQ